MPLSNLIFLFQEKDQFFSATIPEYFQDIFFFHSEKKCYSSCAKLTLSWMVVGGGQYAPSHPPCGFLPFTFKNLQATHTYKFSSFPNFLLRRPLFPFNFFSFPSCFIFPPFSQILGSLAKKTRRGAIPSGIRPWFPLNQNSSTFPFLCNCVYFMQGFHDKECFCRFINYSEGCGSRYGWIRVTQSDPDPESA